VTAQAPGTLAGRAVARSEAGYAVEAAVRHHRVASDEPKARGGTDTGPSPAELVAAALAACTAITLRMYAERKGWELGAVEVDCRAFAEKAGYRFERSIRIGAATTEEQRARLAEIAEKTPVTRLVKAGAPIATAIR
jgi:putative redox protein